MARATWNGVVIAESDETVVVEGNHYFPPDSLKMELLQPSSSTSVCPWKGTAEYFNIAVNGDQLPDGAWVYRSPLPAAAAIKDHVAFWRGVRVES